MFYGYVHFQFFSSLLALSFHVSCTVNIKGILTLYTSRIFTSCLKRKLVPAISKDAHIHRPSEVIPYAFLSLLPQSDPYILRIIQYTDFDSSTHSQYNIRMPREIARSVRGE